ncbi:hypothetical protein A2U01_0066768, partial [Trifolium medium]|nr:hypothetical protein [Trifolium medium]
SGSPSFQVRKGRVVVLHLVLWVVGGGSRSCRILAVLLRVGGLGVFLTGLSVVMLLLSVGLLFITLSLSWVLLDLVTAVLVCFARKSLFGLLCVAAGGC